MVVPCALDDGVPDYNQHEWHISQKTRKKHYRNAVVEQHKQQVIAWEDLTDALKKDKSRRDWSWLLIDPRSSAAIRTWDLITSTALIFTAVVTPFEVGFIDLPKERWTDPLFLANRVVDLIFISDMVMQFFLMYPTTDIKDPAGERWVADHGRIARRYLTSAWFLVDLVSVGVAGFDIFSPTSGPLAKFKGFRAIRVLRLVKLVKLVNASRIFKRWEMRLSINYAKLSIAQVLIGLVFCCHLFGCVWGLQASFDPLNTWPGAKEYCVPWQSATCPDGKVCSADTSTACEQPGSMYLYSVYWAIATVTSIGYGDVAASAFNEVEQLICTIIMLAGAIFFANIVGQFCGLAASLAPEKVQFRYDLSDLNYHMHEEAIPDELRYRLREYFHNTIHLRQGKIRVRLLKLLSPGLAGEFALKMNERWLTDVWFLDGVHCRELQVQIALELRAHVFPHNEIVPLGSMYIVSGRGRALYAGHVLKLGQAFRTDELVAADGLRATYPAIALSYLWTYAITGVKLRELLANCPKAARDVIMRRQMSLTLRRAIVRAAEEECMRLGKMFYGRPHFIYARDTKEVAAVKRERELQEMSTMLWGASPAAALTRAESHLGSRTALFSGGGTTLVSQAKVAQDRTASPAKGRGGNGGKFAGEASGGSGISPAGAAGGLQQAIEVLALAQMRQEQKIDQLAATLDSSLAALRKDMLAAIAQHCRGDSAEHAKEHVKVIGQTHSQLASGQSIRFGQEVEALTAAASIETPKETPKSGRLLSLFSA